MSASMAFMLPVATPPNAIVFGSGRIAIRDMARTGFVLNLVSVGLATLLAQFVLPVVFSFSTP
jgi:sodium-dependent dicarboxylate transporter 2/3/5